MDTLNAIIRFFQSGGVFMYPIVIVFALGAAIATERYLYLSWMRLNNRRVWDHLQPLLQEGEYQAAMEFAVRSKAAVSSILTHGINRAKSARRRHEVEMAMEEGLMEVVPRLEKRTHYLATFANLATLLGLLGTIMGLIEAFTAVSNANPAEKAELLSASISVAMNTTAFGLMVAIPLLLGHAVIQTKTNEIVDSLEMITVRFANLTARNRSQIVGMMP